MVIDLSFRPYYGTLYRGLTGTHSNKCSHESSPPVPTALLLSLGDFDFPLSSPPLSYVKTKEEEEEENVIT